MAVVPMQKVQIVTHRADTDAVLDVLQQAGAMEFTTVDQTAMTPVVSEFKHAQLLPLIQHAVGFLTPYETKKSLWRNLRDGAETVLLETDVKNQSANTDAVRAIVADLEAIQLEFAAKNEAIRQLQEQAALLRIWRQAPVKLADLVTSRTFTLLANASATAKVDNANTTASNLQTVFLNAGVTAEITAIGNQQCLVTVVADEIDVATATKLVETNNAEVVPTPSGVETADIELVAVEEQLAALNAEVAVLHDQAESFAHTHLRTLQIAAEVMTWERDRHDITVAGGATQRAVVLTGWLQAPLRSTIETVIADRKLAAVISEVDLVADEEPPVEITNNALIRPFEAVTRLYGMPGYKDLDPTIFLAGFFFLFFGLSLTDVGYGAFLVAVSAFILFATKAPETIKLFAKLLLFLGVSTMLVGMLFGGYFGIAPESLPPFLQAIALFDPIGNPLPVFYLALGLGVFQVMVGMLLKIYSESRQGRLLDGVLDQGPWFVMFCLGILYLFTTIELVALVPTQTIITMMYVTLGVLVLAAVRNSRTILDVLASAGGSLYASVGYLSDILSYSRLLALGLATTALAFAVNLIAEIVSGSVPYLGTVFAILILIIGHAFTLAVNTLGAFIHSARLQFVEFFGKFIVGTGKEFKPLKRTKKYVTVAKE